MGDGATMVHVFDLPVEADDAANVLASKKVFRQRIISMMSDRKHPVKVDKIEFSTAGDEAKGWAHCSLHDKCLTFSCSFAVAVDQPSFIRVMADQPLSACEGKEERRTGVKQQTKSQRSAARNATKAAPPAAATAALFEAEMPPAEFPDPATMRRARTTELSCSKERDAGAAPTYYCQQWEAWLASRQEPCRLFTDLALSD